MGKTERSVLHGGKHVTSVKVEITSSPNARKCMPYENDNYDQWLMAVSHEKQSINATLTVNDHPVRFQHQVSPTTVCLNMWNKTNLESLG